MLLIERLFQNEKDIFEIPNLPDGYKEKNKNLNDFIKGLLNSKYFIG